MEIFLARHGESANNPLPESAHQPDPELTALGRRQAECLGRHLAALRPAMVLSSPLVRSLATAEPLALATGIPWMVWGDLAEAHRAHPGDGAAVAVLQGRFPAATFAAELHWPGFPGDETPQEAAARAARLAARLVLTGARLGRLAVIGHGNINAYVMRHWMGIPPPAAVRLHQDNAAVHHVRVEARYREILRYNDRAHLVPLP